MCHIKWIFTGLALLAGLASQGAGPKVSAVKWSFRTETKTLCDMLCRQGIPALEMIDSAKRETVKQKGLEIALADGPDLGIERGFCHEPWHAQMAERYARAIPVLASLGVGQVVCYAGVNRLLSDEEALEVCARGLRPVLKIAEKHGVTLVMELISSRPNREPFTKHSFEYYQCDNPGWGAALCEKLGSPRFKLLYDIWHMHDMGRDVVADIRQYALYIGHYHISGVHKRKNADPKDGFDYRACLQAIAHSGYEGYIGIEPDRIEQEIEQILNAWNELITNNLP